MTTRGTLAFAATEVKRLLVAKAIKALRKDVRVPCEVKIFGRSSTRINLRRFGGAALDVDALGTVKPFRVAEGFFSGDEASSDLPVLAFGMAILLSAVKTPN